MLPVLALFHLFHELRSHQFSTTCHVTVRLSAAIKALHQVVRLMGYWIVKAAFKGRRRDAPLQLRGCNIASMDHRYCVDASTFKELQSSVEIEKLFRVLVVNIELEKVVRQVSVMEGVLRVKPFAV